MSRIPCPIIALRNCRQPPCRLTSLTTSSLAYNPFYSCLSLLSALDCTWCRVALLKISCYDLSLVTGCHTDPVKSSTRAPPPVYDNTPTCVYPRLLFAPLQHYISTDTLVSGGQCRMCQAELVITNHRKIFTYM